jgi:hypothetical protein
VHDLTAFVTAARTNEPRAVGALSERFAGARFHLPLASLEGVKNRPETALELGARLPLHRLRLDTGLIAIPLFTSQELCRECARKLSWKTDGNSWKTDGKAIKTLPVPGRIALSYLKDLLLSPEIDRAIVNPLSESDLHLARTEVEAIAAGEPLRALWLYSRNGRLKRPIEIEGGSLLGAILGAATRAVSGAEEPSIETEPPFESLPEGGPASGLAAELYRFLLPDAGGGLEVIVTRSQEGVRIETTPLVDGYRLVGAKTIAEKHLAASPVGTRVRLRIDGSSVVVTSSISTISSGPARKEPELGYIPLEPEPPPEEESGG